MALQEPAAFPFHPIRSLEWDIAPGPGHLQAAAQEVAARGVREITEAEQDFQEKIPRSWSRHRKYQAWRRAREHGRWHAIRRLSEELSALLVSETHFPELTEAALVATEPVSGCRVPIPVRPRDFTMDGMQWNIPFLWQAYTGASQQPGEPPAGAAHRRGSSAGVDCIARSGRALATSSQWAERAADACDLHALCRYAARQARGGQSAKATERRRTKFMVSLDTGVRITIAVVPVGTPGVVELQQPPMASRPAPSPSILSALPPQAMIGVTPASRFSETLSQARNRVRGGQGMPTAKRARSQDSGGSATSVEAEKPSTSPRSSPSSTDGPRFFPPECIGSPVQTPHGEDDPILLISLLSLPAAAARPSGRK